MFYTLCYLGLRELSRQSRRQRLDAAKKFPRERHKDILHMYDVSAKNKRSDLEDRQFCAGVTSLMSDSSQHGAT